MKIIAGLGNPGQKYKNTRHNIGFMVIDALAEQHNLQWKHNKPRPTPWRQDKKFNAEVAEIENAILIKPQTFMNNSGQAVRAVLDYYKLLPKTLGLITKKQTDLSDKLIVIHDDIDIEFGKFKIQKNRSSAGHKGVQSIINHLKTQNFTRVRVGTGRPAPSLGARRPNKTPADSFVLKNFSKEEMDKLKKLIPEIITSCKL